MRIFPGFGWRLLALEDVTDGLFELAIEKIFAHVGVDYIQVNSTDARCFSFRIERQKRPRTQDQGSIEQTV